MVTWHSGDSIAHFSPTLLLTQTDNSIEYIFVVFKSHSGVLLLRILCVDDILVATSMPDFAVVVFVIVHLHGFEHCISQANG